MAGMSNELVSIVIVTCGTKDYLWSLLDSIKKQVHHYLEITVIDNSLSLDFKEKIGRYYPGIQVYSSPTNLFYCQAQNIGIKMSKGNFILCLNDDVVLDKSFIEKALKGFFINEKIGMVSGRILRKDGTTIDTTGLFLTPWRTAKERGYGFKNKGQFVKEEYIFGVNGAVAFYRKTMLEEIKEEGNYFDPDFRMFYEDLDIAWRAQNKGWRGYYIPQALAYHVRGGSARGGQGIEKTFARRYLSDELHMDLIKNRYLTIIKNEGFLGFLLHLPFMFLYDLIAWIFILFSRPKLIFLFFRTLHRRLT
jgi:GT2 family glycosyltransferase